MQTTQENNTTVVLSVSDATPDHLRGCVALFILLAIFVTLNPFADLGDSALQDISSGRETTTYIALILLAGLAGFILHWNGRLPVTPLVTRESVLLLAWLFVMSIGLSIDPAASGRRFVLCFTTFLLAAMLPWLTRGLRHFANLLLVTMVIVLVLSYVGVMVVPDLTIHQEGDIFDQGIAGDWRGIYSHKNLAASIMAVFAYVGRFVARNGRPLIGVSITIAALIFLVCSGGKSALGMVVLVACISVFITRAHSAWGKALIAFGPLLLINFLTVGSVLSDTARTLVSLFPFDTTFTGRTEIWEFALNAIGAHPWKGQGFEAFWYSEAVRYSSEDATRWMVSVASSHNSYVDLALTIGLPGLAFTILVFLMAPFRDFHRTRDTRANQELARLFLELWLFTIYLGTFEAFFLSRANPLWFVLALAACGLRYTSRYDVAD